VNSNNEIQRYKAYPMLHFRRKFSSGVTMHHPSWELGDRLFLTCLLPEPDQVDLRATATASQHLAEGARRSVEAQDATTPLPAYVAEF